MQGQRPVARIATGRKSRHVVSDVKIEFESGSADEFRMPAEPCGLSKMTKPAARSELKAERCRGCNIECIGTGTGNVTGEREAGASTARDQRIDVRRSHERQVGGQDYDLACTLLQQRPPCRVERGVETTARIIEDDNIGGERVAFRADNGNAPDCPGRCQFREHAVQHQAHEPETRAGR